MIKLKVTQVRSTSRLTGALSPGQADQYGNFEDGILTISDSELAEELANNHNVEVVSRDDTPGVEPEQTGSQSGESDNPDDESESFDETQDYPTNQDGDPLCVGMSDGQCSRTVDEPFGTCWQHQD